MMFIAWELATYNTKKKSCIKQRKNPKKENRRINGRQKNYQQHVITEIAIHKLRKQIKNMNKSQKSQSKEMKSWSFAWEFRVTYNIKSHEKKSKNYRRAIAKQIINSKNNYSRKNTNAVIIRQKWNVDVSHDNFKLLTI